MLPHCADHQRPFAKLMLSDDTVSSGLDDRRRAASARWTVLMKENAGDGCMGWGVREGKAVSTRRDR
jgi:hypothetical protein